MLANIVMETNVAISSLLDKDVVNLVSKYRMNKNDMGKTLIGENKDDGVHSTRKSEHLTKDFKKVQTN